MTNITKVGNFEVISHNYQILKNGTSGNYAPK